jgi:hypothetical protein
MKIVTFYDRILHKKNDGFFNNLEPSCHHLGFFLGLELWDISFNSYDLKIYTNVLCTYRNNNFFLQKTKSGQIGITTC